MKHINQHLGEASVGFTVCDKHAKRFATGTNEETGLETLISDADADCTCEFNGCPGEQPASRPPSCQVGTVFVPVTMVRKW